MLYPLSYGRNEADSVAVTVEMVDRQLEHSRMVTWIRRISARSGLNVGTAMPCARPD